MILVEDIPRNRKQLPNLQNILLWAILCYSLLLDRVIQSLIYDILMD